MFTSDSFKFISNNPYATGPGSGESTNSVTLYHYQAKRINGVIYGGTFSNNSAEIAY